MKAFIADGYGPPSAGRFGDIATPKIKSGSLLVQLRAAAVNPFDYKAVTGLVKDFLPISFPYVPGSDGAGVIAQTGDGVDGWQAGDRVFGLFSTGTYAQFALIAAKHRRLARIPDGLDFEHAAAIPVTGATALTLLRAGNVSAGNNVLILGATGGVGSFATQLAKAQGAKVIATGKGEDRDYLRALGADDVVDYISGDPITQAHILYPGGVDVLIDLVNSGNALLDSARALRTGGTLVSPLGGPPQDAFPNGVTVHYIQMHPEEGDLDSLARSTAAGELHIEIAGTYDLSDAARALADLFERHTRGKLVLRIPQ
jgi:NADPH:quinone reductase